MNKDFISAQIFTHFSTLKDQTEFQSLVFARPGWDWSEYIVQETMKLP